MTMREFLVCHMKYVRCLIISMEGGQHGIAQSHQILKTKHRSILRREATKKNPVEEGNGKPHLLLPLKSPCCNVTAVNIHN